MSGYWYRPDTGQHTVLQVNFCLISSKIVSFTIYVVVNSLSQVIFVFLLFLGMVMYANEIETKEK